MVEKFGDADEHIEVDAVAFEHLVDVAAFAVDGTGEPGHRASLRLQFRLYHLSYVYVAHDRYRSLLGTKNRELCLSVAEVLQYPYHK